MANQLNELKYGYLAGLGYTGALPDKEWLWRNASGYGSGSLYDVYGLAGYSGSINERAHAYFNYLYNTVADGVAPSLSLDFVEDKYVNEGVHKTLVDLITCGRSTTKTTIDASGLLVEVAANTPATTYNPVTLERLGVVDEPEATNLFTYSDDFTDASWNKILATVTADQAVGIDGAMSMDKLNDDASTGTGSVHINQAFTVSASTVYTYSIVAKADQLSKLLLYTVAFTTPANNGFIFDLSAGTYSAYSGTPDHTATMENLGGGLYRCAITFITDATDLSGTVRNYLVDTTEVVDLDGTSSVFIGNAQFEEGSAPSSIIHTTGSAATRNADNLSVVVDGSDPYTGYDQTKVSGKIRLTPRVDGALTYISYNDTTANEAIKVHQDASNNILLTVTDGGVDQCAIDSGVNAVVGTEITIAFRAGANDFAISVDGNIEVTDTSGSMPTVTQQEFGGAGVFAGEVFYNELITDLAGLST